jgi:hypothetical protein
VPVRVCLCVCFVAASECVKFLLLSELIPSESLHMNAYAHRPSCSGNSLDDGPEDHEENPEDQPGSRADLEESQRPGTDAESGKD